MVTVHMVLVHLGERASTAHYACSHAITDLVGRQVWTGIKHYDAVSIVHNVVPVDPAEASLDQEDAFAAGRTDLVVDDHGISSFSAAQRNVRLEVLKDLVRLYVCPCALN